MADSSDSDSGSPTGIHNSDLQGKKGFFQGRSHQSLKTTSTASTSVELHDPNDPFDPNESLGFDWNFLKRFWCIHELLFVKIYSLPATLFYTLVLFTLLQEYVIYQVGLVPSKFYKVLGDKDINGFWQVSLSALGIIVSISLVKSSQQYLLKLLTVTWRQVLCKAIHRSYFKDVTYYQLNVLDKKIDNPDQRMTQDVDKLTSTYCEILPRIIVSPVVLSYYTYKGFVSTGWQGPVGCFAFFLLGTVFNKLLMGPIVGYVAAQEKCEGDFRFIHMQIRTNSESIAFHDASSIEGEKADLALLKLAKAQHKLYLRQFFLNVSMNLFDYLGSIVSYFIIALPLFAGLYDHYSPSDISALISKNSFIAMYLIYQFSQLVDISIKVTDVAGVTHRVAQLLERLIYLQNYWHDKYIPDGSVTNNSKIAEFEEFAKRRDPGNGNSELPETTESTLIPAWILENISFTAPFRQKSLVRDLTITISAGQSILIVGGSSAGKSSLLRVLRGLWPYCNGKITRLYPPGCQGIYFVPQKPFMTSGTLREQIAFPYKPDDKADGHNDHLILKYLKMLRLKPLLERIGSLDEPVPWSVYESLSPGEIQRIYFIRVFLHRPIIALLDEATSALPLNMEDIVYKECQRLGITLVSVGHRESLRSYHDVLLTLELSGNWKLEKIEKPNIS
ncbi:unnamed protein product [Allacma fusca]|uniref:ATP-binding cassette sub-family D member 4 n=1 Tax=Allacma fusca TaxID=39272 RepID=A0A8J2P0B9_9HEXA|nr:unnamed protein product [Allacma fusca]